MFSFEQCSDPDLSPHRDGRAEARTVVLTTTALEAVASLDGKLGNPFGARKIVLEGEDAEFFLKALPVYAPVFEGA